MEIFLHQRAKDAEFVEDVDPDTKIGDFAKACLSVGAWVWIEGREAPLDPGKTLIEIGIYERCHLHVSHCKEIHVKIRFNGQSAEKPFPPPTSADSILKWAASPDNFNLTGGQIAKHLLVVSHAELQLDRAEHIGRYADDDCCVCLDLVPEEKFAG